ncbi:MAG: histidine--tRNA ligase, partial [Lentisphaerae bacterium]|nr:histidine--tRNA ligase [Lentisphaerota bacterium]
KKPVEGIGFAAGMERLLLARASLGRQTTAVAEADIAIISLGENAILPGLRLAQELRATLSGLRVKADFTGRSLKAQMRGANRSGARLALIRGDNELAENVVLCRDMTTSEQQSVPAADLMAWIDERRTTLFA